MKRSTETQHRLSVVAAVVWIRNISINSFKAAWVTFDGWIRHPKVIQIGSITIPTKKSATDNEAKNRLETARKDSFLKNNHNTTAFPVTAAKPDEEKHSERTMDASLLLFSFKQPTVMVIQCKRRLVIEEWLWKIRKTRLKNFFPQTFTIFARSTACDVDQSFALKFKTNVKIWLWYFPFSEPLTKRDCRLGNQRCGEFE